jgi:hypothetical protein
MDDVMQAGHLDARSTGAHIYDITRQALPEFARTCAKGLLLLDEYEQQYEQANMNERPERSAHDQSP